MFRLLVWWTFVISVCGIVSPNIRKSFSIYETVEDIISHGYPAERHHVTTEDGYILEMHRIPMGKGQNESMNRPVVFLMHGLLSSSNSFIALGPETGIAYNLADAGFDVWMGNARGTKNSRNHTSLNPDDPIEKFQFFNFSFEEIGTSDLPAMIDSILNKTGRDNLHYIGHSQGGTVFLVLASTRPNYNKKIKTAHLLAGVGYQKHCPNNKLVMLAPFTDFMYALSLQRGVVELYPPQPNDPLDNNYTEMLKMVGMEELIQANNETDPSSNIAGAAMKQVAHYGQTVRDKAFRRWNYGIGNNTVIYGQSNPPEYDLSLITSHVTMHYTIGDTILDERDVLAMAEDMPNANVRKIARGTFLHSDFTKSDDNKELVTDFIIKSIRSSEGIAMGSSSSLIVSVMLKMYFLLYILKIIIY